MTSVIGFEGSVRPDDHVTWGAAAVEYEDGRVLNSITKRIASPQEKFALIDGQAFTILKTAIHVPDDWASSQMLVVILRTASPFYSILKVDPGRLGEVESKRTKSFYYYVFKNTDSFQPYTKEVAHRILSTVLDDSEPQPSHLDLVRAGLTLDASHPYLNALRVFIAGDESEQLTRLARANTRGARGQHAFDLLLHALHSDKRFYELTYEHGVTQGGGLDVDFASVLFEQLETLHRKFKEAFHDDYPFLTPPPFPRFRQFQAASATLSFGTNVEGRPLSERVARYLELRMFEQTLSGDIPVNVDRDRKFDSALEKLVRLTEDTTLRHKPIDKTESEAVAFDEVPAGEISRHEITVIGIHTGLYHDAQYAEVRIFDDLHGRLFLSLRDNGDNREPIGAKLFSKQSLWEILVLRLNRHSDSAGREKLFLVEAVLLEERERTLTGVPSRVVEGAFCFVPNLQVLRANHSIRLGDRAIQASPLENFPQSMNWLASYVDAAYEIELDPNRDRRWLAPTRVKRAKSLDRVLVSLDYLGGEAEVSRLVEEISRRFDTAVRVNNTRREVYRHPDLLEFSDEADKSMKLTEKGIRHLAAYKAAGGRLGLTPE